MTLLKCSFKDMTNLLESLRGVPPIFSSKFLWQLNEPISCFLMYQIVTTINLYLSLAYAYLYDYK